jgi:hypothetical protein
MRTVAIRIEDAETVLRELLARRGVDVAQGPADVLPVFQEFCEQTAISDSDMVLWEVAELAESHKVDGAWVRSDPLWCFVICRQLERGLESEASEDHPAGFYQITIRWRYPRDTSASAFFEWRDDAVPLPTFFDRVRRSPETQSAMAASVTSVEVDCGWV